MGRVSSRKSRSRLIIGGGFIVIFWLVNIRCHNTISVEHKQHYKNSFYDSRVSTKNDTARFSHAKKPPAHSSTRSSGSSNQNDANENTNTNKLDGLCASIDASLNIQSWPPIRYHKDRDSKDGFVQDWFASVEEDDADARATIAEFNRIAASDNPVLTRQVLDHGITLGNDHRALSFLEKLATSSQATPVNIAVFGNSFTIGSNCAESTVNLGDSCAWPSRARRRLNEVLSLVGGGNNTITKDKQDGLFIDWHMWQENAQAAVVIANKLPGFIDFFSSRNKTVDAILIDTSMTELKSSEPWFEAVMRAFHEVFPNTMVLSIIDGKRDFVTPDKPGLDPRLIRFQIDYLQWLRDIHQKYQVTVVDIAKMVVLDNTNQNSTKPVDRLWPQSLFMTDGHGVRHNEKYMLRLYNEMHKMGNEFYWTNFIPKVRKKVHANYPNTHPPWPTHQYVADTVTQALLRTANRACNLRKEKKQVAPSILPMDTVSEPEKLQACTICLKPLTSIDAKKPPENDAVVTNICGDWKWITDERNRAGWQSDKVGSLLRIRFETSATHPLILVTYTGSYETFGEFRVTFRRPHEPLTNCAALSTNQTIPSMMFNSDLPEYTLPKIATFPSKYHLVTKEEFQLLNATILSSQTVRKRKENKSGQTIDLYIENTGDQYRHRVKIQMVTAC